MNPSTLLLGIGNPLRSDDGVGAFICSQLEVVQQPGLVVQTTQQLQTEFIEEFLKYDRVLVIDASVTANEVKIERVQASGTAVASSHHMTLSLMAALSQQVYGKELYLYSCAIPVISFKMGNELSAVAIEQAEKAITVIREWLQEN
ncbi:MAG: hydrogenase maturation protease [Chitinophagaceae bacterium]